MIVQFSKWGNSLALRIPAPALKDIGATEGTSADIQVVDGKIIISPIPKKRRYSLEELVAGITKENMHEALDSGEPVGNEIW